MAHCNAWSACIETRHLFLSLLFATRTDSAIKIAGCDMVTEVRYPSAALRSRLLGNTLDIRSFPRSSRHRLWPAMQTVGHDRARSVEGKR
jgi:hypothetical protein